MQSPEKPEETASRKPPTQSPKPWRYCVGDRGGPGGDSYEKNPPIDQQKQCAGAEVVFEGSWLRVEFHRDPKAEPMRMDPDKWFGRAWLESHGGLEYVGTYRMGSFPRAQAEARVDCNSSRTVCKGVWAVEKRLNSKINYDEGLVSSTGGPQRYGRLLIERVSAVPDETANSEERARKARRRAEVVAAAKRTGHPWEYCWGALGAKHRTQYEHLPPFDAERDCIPADVHFEDGGWIRIDYSEKWSSTFDPNKHKYSRKIGTANLRLRDEHEYLGTYKEDSGYLGNDGEVRLTCNSDQTECRGVYGVPRRKEIGEATFGRREKYQPDQFGRLYLTKIY